MVKDLKRGDSSRSPPRDGEGPSASPKKGNKAVTFDEGEIVPYDGTTSSPPRAPPKDHFKNKKKVGVNFAKELDEGMDKMRAKDPGNLVRLYSEQPWEVDPAQLTIGKVIGHGTFGHVYYGKYNGQQVAIKMLEWGDSTGDTSISGDPRDISLQYKFFMEVETMFKLGDHPNICKFLGATMGTTNLTIPSPLGKTQVPVSQMMCCIIMEYVPRGTLRQFWINHRKAGRRRMPFTVIVQFAIDIARGLQYLHSKRILHRDLKPDNILMESDCSLKIADFGISRPWPEKGEEMSLYRGTPSYTAPEILRGNANYNHKCDVYSYGICIWELYACDAPHRHLQKKDQGQNNEEIYKNNLRPKIPLCCPAELRRIIVRCWDRDPARRPEMTEVLEWLSRIDTDLIRCTTNECLVETCACVLETWCKC